MNRCLKGLAYIVFPLGVLLAPFEGIYSGRVSASGPNYGETRSTLNEVNRSREIYQSRPNAASRHFPRPELDSVFVDEALDGGPLVDLAAVEHSQSLMGERITVYSQDKDFVFLSLDPQIQKSTQSLVQKANAPHAVAVVMNPRSGEILALAQKSNSLSNMFAHHSFPAASLFKIITAAAGLEQSDVTPESVIRFRGGTYTLQPWNYRSDPKRDQRHMTLSEAMGRSCNPVFARVALGHLNPEIVRFYANSFGFNKQIAPQLLLPKSSAHIPSEDYQFSRTAAGFGDVHITPVHAAALMAGIANHGVMTQPRVINKIIDDEGKVVYRTDSEVVGRMVHPRTAKSLMDMLEFTTTIGTSKREFVINNKRVFPHMRVVGKTGTLSGKNPKGVHNWFIGAAPKENPELVVATLVIYPGMVSTRASRIARQIMEQYFKSDRIV